MTEEVVRQMCPVGGHKVDGFDGAKRNDPIIFTTIAHHANGAHRQEHGERLADLVVEVGFAQLFDKTASARRKISQYSFFTSPRTRTPRPGPGKG